VSVELNGGRPVSGPAVLIIGLALLAVIILTLIGGPPPETSPDPLTVTDQTTAPAVPYQDSQKGG
jgi:hypothetical protein